MGQCFLYGSGSGRSKNYWISNVYGGANPPTAGVKVYDIFLRTNVALLRGELTANVQSTPLWTDSDGAFIISLVGGVFPNTSRSAYFASNAQHKNFSISGYPGQAYIYENGGWRNCEGYIWNGSAWIQFSSLRINLTYFADQCTGVTGGWSNIRWFTDSHAAGHVPTVSWNSDGVHIKSDTPPGPGGIVVTKNAVNLTGWSKIVVNCASVSGTEVYCRVSKNTGDSFMTGQVTYIYLKAGVNTLDITSLNGVYYIGLCTYYNNSMVVSQVYLE